MKPNITAIIPGSAAEASGFLPGDQVFAVNGLYTGALMSSFELSIDSLLAQLSAWYFERTAQ